MSVKARLNTLRNMNDKMYPKLSSDERFKMVIETFVNNDEVQREKLVKSCPQFMYLESDHSYTERIEASRDIVTIFIIQLLEYDKTLSIIKILNGFNKDRKLNIEKRFINEVQSFLFAFEIFCREHVGVESQDMIQAWYGYDDRYIRKIEKIKQSIDFYQLDHDSELMANWLKRVFIPEWQRRMS
ncbi:hypothetical protein [Halobacillus sp. BBL2006]|uniref:hypothetical protein n=1 Tax=Halobacillus sp. BBL2006 TaxID=1543706 RepID=UPI000541FA17|nr:hypothetical protein [Halobacillus sp. BBL2006]KHE72484.1 hypothetical protein LD39_04280 [Halobacillus sp. BBL2006]